MVARYRNKSNETLIIEAVQYSGDNWREIINFSHAYYFHLQKVIKILTSKCYPEELLIGDYVINDGGLNWNFSICKRNIFEMNYEKVD